MIKQREERLIDLKGEEVVQGVEGLIGEFARDQGAG